MPPPPPPAPRRPGNKQAYNRYDSADDNYGLCGKFMLRWRFIIGVLENVFDLLRRPLRRE